MTNPESKQLFDKGMDALSAGNILAALSCFENVPALEEDPLVGSFYAFCIAKERGEFQKAISICDASISKEPGNSLHYLNLGKIYLLKKDNKEAIDIFRRGLNCEENRQIAEELNKLGTRKPPLIPFLKRSNIINKYLGLILGRLKLR
jgi:tetratricopeptide (TPR) repeat protein